MADLNRIILDTNLLRNETGQDYCLIEKDSFEKIKENFYANIGVYFEEIFGDSFQIVNDCFLMSSAQKKELIDYIKNA